ncbi:MAG: hypothetical protein WC419_04130, partial [Candidatus Omnitrophota bacterium]
MKNKVTLPKLNHRRFPLIIRLIALILTVTFLAQDIVWANPDQFISKPAHNNKLAPSTFFSLKDSKDRGGALFIEYLIENNKLFHSNISLIAVQHLLKRDDVKVWLTNNKIVVEPPDYTHDGQLGAIRINTPAGYTLRYYDPTLKLKNPFVCDPRSVTDSKELNPRLHKQIVKSRTLSLPEKKLTALNSPSPYSSGMSPDAAFGKGVTLRH